MDRIMTCGHDDRMKIEGPAVVSSTLLKHAVLSKHHHLLTFHVPTKFDRPVPGQFIMIRPQRQGPMFLARPMSVYGHREGRDGARLQVLFRTVGTGTQHIASLKAGESVMIVGPLGQGFRSSPDTREVILLCGGMGIAPLTFLAERIRHSRPKDARPRITAYYGAGSAHDLIGLETLSSYASDIFVATEDGSMGQRGRVTDLFASRIAQHQSQRAVIFACGPKAMLRHLSQILGSVTIPCQVSMEERMACGLGACLGCVIPVYDGDGNRHYERVCREGPVFDIRTVLPRPSGTAT